MTDIIEDYLRELEKRLQVDAERKAQIVSEIRSHLREKVAELQALEPERSADDVARQVIADFGNPHDLALAYGPHGTVLKSEATGEEVLRLGRDFGRAVGRGTKAFLKGVAITLIVLLVIGTVVGAWAYHEFKPLVQSSMPYEVYGTYESCYRGNCTSDASREFYVHANAREVRMEVWLDRPTIRVDESVTVVAYGSVVLSIQDPTGRVLYNRTFSPVGGEDVREEVKWSPTAGNWTASLKFDEFRGTLHLSIDAIGLPKDVEPRLSEVF